MLAEQPASALAIAGSSIDLERCSVRARPALRQAAERDDGPASQHLVSLLLDDDGTLVPRVLSNLGVDAPVLLERLSVLDGPPSRGDAEREVLQAVRSADHRAQRSGDRFITTEHLLAALAGARRRGRDKASRVWPGPPVDRTGGRGDPRELASHRSGRGWHTAAGLLEPARALPTPCPLQPRPDRTCAPGRA